MPDHPWPVRRLFFNNLLKRLRARGAAEFSKRVVEVQPAHVDIEIDVCGGLTVDIAGHARSRDMGFTRPSLAFEEHHAAATAAKTPPRVGRGLIPLQ